VRIALALKGVIAEKIPVHLVKNGGEQHSNEYRQINSQGRVPAIELEDGSVIIQSSAIIEYLEEKFPTPPLLPQEVVKRAQVRGVASIIGSDIHALHNLGPLNYLRLNLERPEKDVRAWIQHWISAGLAAVEDRIEANEFCFGPAPGLADVYLVPQIYAARRFEVSLSAYPKIVRADAVASEHPAFLSAHPSRQLDAE
jgi:maleylacetoacetate isomerase